MEEFFPNIKDERFLKNKEEVKKETEENSLREIRYGTQLSITKKIFEIISL